MIIQPRFYPIGLLIISGTLLTVAFFTGLPQPVQYPNILRMGADYLLTEYHKLVAAIHSFWYGLTFWYGLIRLPCR